MNLLELTSVEETKSQLEELVKPFQQEQNRRQKKADFVKKCIQCVEKNDFFQLDELLKSKQASDVLEDPNFQECQSIFSQLQAYADEQIEQSRLQFKDALLRSASEVGIPMTVDWPKFFVLKGIQGEVDFTKRTTVINQTTIKSIDPKRIAQAALNIKRKLYDSPFEPETFINALFACYKEILKQSNQGVGNPVPIVQFYTDYVMSLQSKTFFQNMDKGKFRGYSLEQFAVDLWRFFESKAICADGYFIKLSPGRGKPLSLIDHDGQERQITHVSFTKVES